MCVPIRWGLLYGTILTNARAMGEFGAVSVISGNILGKTQTLTLFVESAYKVNPLHTHTHTHTRPVPVLRSCSQRTSGLACIVSGKARACMTVRCLL